VAVMIRMKRMGRTHRGFFRICATDKRSPRDGRVIEELGTYDPSVPETDARCLLKGERIDYWLSVGAKPSEKVGVLIKKYGTNGTHLKEMEEARARLAMPRAIPDPGEPAFKPEEKTEAPEAEAAAESAEAPAAAESVEAPQAAEAAAESTEAAAESTEAAAPAEASSEEPAADAKAEAGEAAPAEGGEDAEAKAE
jgi:small subunit ribosomal protein S16